MSEFNIDQISKYKRIRNKITTTIEKPCELKGMLDLKLTEFWINTNQDAYCNEIEEIHMEFQGKEMKIFINDDGKLQIYTD